MHTGFFFRTLTFDFPVPSPKVLNYPVAHITLVFLSYLVCSLALSLNFHLRTLQFKGRGVRIRSSESLTSIKRSKGQAFFSVPSQATPHITNLLLWPLKYKNQALVNHSAWHKSSKIRASSASHSC